MLLHVNGTNVPGAPASPEYLKALVCLPPALVNHHRHLEPTIMRIVQLFLESVGVETVRLWADRARRCLNYSLTQVGTTRQNPAMSTMPLPEPLTSSYTFFGQPISASSLSPPSSSADSSGYDEPTAEEMRIIELTEQLAVSQNHNEALTKELQRAKQMLTQLRRPPPNPSSPRPVTPTKTPVPPASQFVHRPYATISSPLSPSIRRSVTSGGSLNAAVSSPQLSPSPFRYQSQALADGDDSGELSQSVVGLFLQRHELTHHEAAVNMIIECVPAREHIRRLIQLGITPELAPQLAAAITMDQA